MDVKSVHWNIKRYGVMYHQTYLRLYVHFSIEMEVQKKVQKDVLEEELIQQERQIRSSWSYRVGYFILSPIKK